MLLWGGQTVSEMGSAVTQLALPAGAIVDRMRKRRIMIWCDLARVALIGSIPVAAALGALIGGALGTAIGIRPTIWIGAAGSLAAGLWVFFSPLRTMRDV
jgi:predicted MFS family arabinose efflux permease